MSAMRSVMLMSRMSAANPADAFSSSISIGVVLEAVVSRAIPDHVATNTWGAQLVYGILSGISTEATDNLASRDFGARTTNLPSSAQWAGSLICAPFPCIEINILERVSILIDHKTNRIKKVAVLTCGTPTLDSHQALRENLGPSKDSLGDDEFWSQPSELLNEDK